MSVRIMSAIFQARVPDLSYCPPESAAGERSVSSSTLKFVLLAMADNANDEGENAYPSISTLAQKTGLSEKSIKNALGALKQHGWIERTGVSRYQTPIYRIVVDKLAVQGGNVVPPLDDGGGGNVVPPGGERGSPEPSLNHPLNHQLNHDGASAPEPPAETPKPDKPKRRRKKSENKPDKPPDPLKQLGSIKAYRDAYGKWPNDDQTPLIADGVPEDDIPAWVDALKHWREHGWNKFNIRSLVDHYRAGGRRVCQLCERNRKNGAVVPKNGNGNGHKPDDPPPPPDMPRELWDALEYLRQNPPNPNNPRRAPMRNMYLEKAHAAGHMLDVRE